MQTTDDSLVINFNKAARSELSYGKDITTEQITIGTTVVPPYKGSRFAVERTTDAEDRIYRLTINGGLADVNTSTCYVMFFDWL
jgi:hypothetical protein